MRAKSALKFTCPPDFQSVYTGRIACTRNTPGWLPLPKPGKAKTASGGVLLLAQAANAATSGVRASVAKAFVPSTSRRMPNGASATNAISSTAAGRIRVQSQKTRRAAMARAGTQR